MTGPRVCPVCGCLTILPILVDLFCGEGGASMGYSRAGWHVCGVDNSAARLARYPFGHLEADALEFLYGLDPAAVDLVAASPTCTGYSRGTVALPDRLERYDRLIAATRELLLDTGLPYIIENVEDAKPELRDPVTLCWTHFYRPGSVLDADGTPLWMRRHRLFESNLPLLPAGECKHPKRFALSGLQCAGAYGGARRNKEEARNVRKGGYVPSVDVMRELLGIEWMSEKGCQLSIPPVYTEHLGGLALDILELAA